MRNDVDTTTITLTVTIPEAAQIYAFLAELRDGRAEPRRMLTSDHNHTAYRRDHKAVKDARGSARGYECIECSDQADHWAYMHTGANESACPRCGITSSSDVSAYEPMCAKCHRRYDQTVRAKAEIYADSQQRQNDWKGAAIACIQNAREPLPTSEILANLASRGLGVNRSTLATYLANEALTGTRIQATGTGGQRRYATLEQKTTKFGPISTVTSGNGVHATATLGNVGSDSNSNSEPIQQ